MTKKINGLIVFLILLIIGVLIYMFFSNEVSLEKIVLDKKEISLYVGEKGKINVSFVPINAKNKTILWKSNNPSVAEVDKNGIISSIEVGEADIIVSTTDGNIKEMCHVIVKNRDIEKIVLSDSKLVLKIGDKKTLKALAIPENASYSKLIYQSMNLNVAKVDENGNIEAVGLGVTEIIVRDENGTKEAKCEITVSSSLERIVLDKEKVDLTIGTSTSLKATLIPSDVLDKTITWSSSNSSIVTVNSNGKITAKALGEAIIVAKNISGNKEASCKVTVKKRTIPVQSVVINMKKITLEVGKKYGLIAKVKPTNADNQNVSWSSNDKNIAVVDANGVVTAIGSGTTSIIATSEDGNKTKSCLVVVKGNNSQANFDGKVRNPIIPTSYIDKYEGTTLKFYIQNNSRYYLTYIWMQNPANQIRKMDAMTAQYGKVMTDEEQDANGLTRYRKTIGDTMNAYISKGIIPVNKAAVGYNGGGFYASGAWDPPSPYYDKRSSTWLVYHNGLLTRNRINDDKAPTNMIIGITGSGDLKFYGSGHEGPAKRQQIYDETVADKVQNTWAFNPLIIGEQVDSSWWDKSTAQRNAICQVDSNNYIMYTSTNGTAHYFEMQSLFSSLGCKIAFNLDGGGSTSMFVKKPGETSVTKMKCGANPCRTVVEGIYFTEK